MVAFFDNPGKHPNTVAKVLGQLFPAVMQDMREMKLGTEPKAYCRLAHFAQRIESAFMFGRVVPRIMELCRTCLSRRFTIAY